MSAKWATAAGAIRSRFATQWKAARGYTDTQMGFTAVTADRRVAWPGSGFTPPDAEWVRFALIGGAGFELTMGGSTVGKNETRGIVSVQVFVKPGSGTGTIEGYCDDVRDIYNRVELSGSGYVVRFGAASAPRELDKEDGWIGFVIDTPFTLEETV